MRPESIVVSSGRPHEPGAPVNTSITATSTYRSDPSGHNEYARAFQTDIRSDLETALGALEGGTALAFPSGMAAITTAIASQPHARVAVVPTTAYSGTITAFSDLDQLGRIEVRRVDVADTAAVLAALDGADLLWLEPVTNPLLTVADLPVLLDAARARNAFTVVDATFSTPLNIRPLELGADIVMHSVTKYLAGHSDVLMGSLATTSPELAERLDTIRISNGAIAGTLESFLALRGLRTLVVRFERAQANAVDLARRLAGHPAVARVRYPGLPDDPGHEVAARTMAGFGAMISFEVAGGLAGADRVAAATRLITNATSLGGVESLIERRAMHPIDEAMGTPANLLRFSVGIEHVEDLWDDLDQALRTV